MPHAHGCITEVDGVLVGHATDLAARTGCTALLFPDGAVGGMDIGGSAPATRDTDMLVPTNMIEKIHGITLSGGSVFGLRAADGVQFFLREQGIGYQSTPGVVIPIVPSAAIFDLAVGNSDVRTTPGRTMGLEAAQAAGSDRSEEGSVGCGTGATCGRVHGIDHGMKGGLGSSSITLGNGVTVGALVVCNAWGDVLDPDTGQIVAGARDPVTREWIDTEAYIFSARQIETPFFGSNTTLCVVATNARFTREQITKVANMAQDGIARAIRPSHTLFDGDIVFAVATGQTDAAIDLNIVGALAARLVSRSIVHGVSIANGGIRTIVKDFEV